MKRKVALFLVIAGILLLSSVKSQAGLPSDILPVYSPQILISGSGEFIEDAIGVKWDFDEERGVFIGATISDWEERTYEIGVTYSLYKNRIDGMIGVGFQREIIDNEEQMNTCGIIGITANPDLFIDIVVGIVELAYKIVK